MQKVEETGSAVVLQLPSLGLQGGEIRFRRLAVGRIPSTPLIRRLERNQSKRAPTRSCEGGFFLRKKPLGSIAFGVQLLWFRCSQFFEATYRIHLRAALPVLVYLNLARYHVRR